MRPLTDGILQRNAMDKVLGDIDVEDPTAVVDSDDEIADVAPRAVQKQEKQKKDKKKSKKTSKTEGAESERKKKRTHSDVNGEVQGKKVKSW